MKKHVWKVFEFSGWFVLLVGIIFGLLYGALMYGVEMVGSGILLVLGIIFVLIGEFLIERHGKESKYHMIWQALSIGGAFAMTVGIIWLAIQFLALYESWYAIMVLVALGVGLILVGEAIKVKT